MAYACAGITLIGKTKPYKPLDSLSVPLNGHIFLEGKVKE
jgi:hypothetical protein